MCQHTMSYSPFIAKKHKQHYFSNHHYIPVKLCAGDEISCNLSGNQPVFVCVGVGMCVCMCVSGYVHCCIFSVHVSLSVLSSHGGRM